MDVKTIMTLLDKGATMDEIRLMGLLDPPKPDKPADGARAEPEKPEAKPKAKPEAKPETKPEANPEAKPEAKKEERPQDDPVLQAIEKLTGTVLRFMSGSTGRDTPAGETADEILAKVFYPQKAEEVE